MENDEDLVALIHHKLDNFLIEYHTTNTLWVAYSGGLDSQVLLEILARYPSQKLVKAIHVHHGVNPQADSWVNHCQQQAKRLNIPLEVRYLTITPKKDQSLEEALREARYQVFASLLEKDHVLLTAHHEDDQAETLLLRLLRGAGPKGLSSMLPLRKLDKGHLFRPLLNSSRLQLEHFAKSLELSWIEDDSNTNQKFDRNFLRHRIIPELKIRWPSVTKSIARSAEISSQTEILLQEYLEQDFQWVNSHNGHCLNITRLKQLTLYRQQALIRYWLEKHDRHLPSQAQLTQILKTVVNCAFDKNPTVYFHNSAVHRYQDNLYVEEVSEFDGHVKLEWDLKKPLILPFKLGQIEVKSAMRGNGLKLPQDNVTIRFRQFGERCHPKGRQGSHPLKKLFQEWDIPPWLRAKIPLVYYHDEIIAVVGYCICQGFAASESECGIEFIHIA